MPRPRFVECGFCGRMFTIHSVEVHEVRCADNPAAIESLKKAAKERPVQPKDNMPRPTNEPQDQGPPVWKFWKKSGNKENAASGSNSPGKSPTKPPVVPSRRSPSAGGNGSGGARPNTVTLSRSDSSGSTGLMGPSTRVCFVCGQRFSERSLPIHEKKCLQLWQQQKAALPKTVKCNQPTKVDIPSVDGTLDQDRVDKMAAQSSLNAQKLSRMRKLQENAGAWRRQGTLAKVQRAKEEWQRYQKKEQLMEGKG